MTNLLLAIASFGQTVIRKPIPENKLTIPDYHGLYAVQPNGLAELPFDRATPNISPESEFLFYSKNVSIAEGFQLFKIIVPTASERRPVQNQNQNKPFSWDDFNKSIGNYIEDQHAAMEGLSRDSVSVELKTKSIAGQPEMIRLIPAASLLPGSYQIGLRAAGYWCHFTVGVGDGPAVQLPPVEELSNQTGGGGIQSSLPRQDVAESVQKSAYWPVLKKAIEAKGGLESVYRTRAFMSRTKGNQIVGKQGPIPIEATIYCQSPGKMRQEVTFGMPGHAVRQAFGIRNGIGWELVGGQRKEMPSTVFESLRREQFFAEVESLRTILDGSCPAELAESTKIEGKDCPTLNVRGPGGFSASLVFDSDSGNLLRRRYTKSDAKGNVIAAEVIYSKFEERSGVKMHTHGILMENGAVSGETDIVEIQFLKEVPDAYFEPSWSR
ncbi:MAG TPA: hypothetical protein VMF06_19990 [Candidatus Limnocylindria bacterium]|nr:hypothetical protein [Candidatus Limnocylindria bacterium]